MIEIINIRDSNSKETDLNLCADIGKLSLPIFYDYNNLNDILDIDTYNIYLAKNMNRVIGFGITSITEDNNIHIMSFGCHPEYRRKNIGTKILNKIKKKNKDKLITLYVQSENSVAIKFYKKNKFIEIEKVSNYYSDLEDNNAILMAFINNKYFDNT